jgi:hypothetical protein
MAAFMNDPGDYFKLNLAMIAGIGYIIVMTNAKETYCPYCGEPIGLEIDASGGAAQEFISDCEVCCRPIRMIVTWDGEGQISLHAEAESA